jgi:hypothetical protein
MVAAPKALVVAKLSLFCLMLRGPVACRDSISYTLGLLRFVAVSAGKVVWLVQRLAEQFGISDWLI